MITIHSGKMTIPEDERFIGFAGDNIHSQKQFFIDDVTDANCIYRLYLTFDNSNCNYFTLDSEISQSGTTLTWLVTDEHILKSGTVQAQIKAFSSDNEVFHTTDDYFLVGSSAEFADYFSDRENSEFLTYERELNTILLSIKAQQQSQPYVGDDGYWYIFNFDSGEYEKSDFVSVNSTTAALDFDSEMSNTSENAVKNMVIKEYIEEYVDASLENKVAYFTRNNMTKVDIDMLKGSASNAQFYMTISDNELCTAMSITSADKVLMFVVNYVQFFYVISAKKLFVREYDVLEMTWSELSAVFDDIDTSSLVPVSRQVAGLNLSQDISAQSLKTALDIDENAVADFAATAIPNYLKWEQGYIDASGINSTTAGYYRTDYISIDNAFKYYLFMKNLSENQGVVRYFQYDENREYITKININIAANNQTTALMNTGNAAYIRLLCSDNLDRESARVYCNEQIATVSKQQLKDLTDGMPKKLEPQNEYFYPNSRIVLVGDSITQGFGSTGLVSYSKSEDGVTVNIKGNGPEYGVLHNLRTYRYGKKLWQNGTSTITRWYEALDGSGWAHKFKNYVQNRYGCTVSNYGMSGITTGHLISNMSSENSDLLTVSDGTLSVIQGLAKNADVVILMIGTNDRGYANISAFTTNLNTIVSLLTNSGKKVILMTSIPAADDNVRNITMAQINAATKEYSQTNNLLHISLYEKMMAYISMADITLSEVTKADGIHPNDHGYEIMYTLLLDALCMNTADQSFVNSAITAAVGNVESLLEALL